MSLLLLRARSAIVGAARSLSPCSLLLGRATHQHHRWWLALFRPIAAARCRRITCEHGSAPWLALLGFRLFLPRWLFLLVTSRCCLYV